MATFTTTLTFILSVSLLLNIGHSFSRVLKSYDTIKLPTVTGPESLAFDAEGGGPYTGVSDGRILKWESSSQKWVKFATVKPQRNGEICNGDSVDEMEDRCGRPLGLKFNYATGELYIADAYYGLMVVGSKGGVAMPLSAGSKGDPFFFANGVDVDKVTGIVYFTHTSTQFKRRDWIVAIAAEDSTGRFMSYNPKTRKTKVLATDLKFPNGVAISKDGSFAVVAESTRRRLLKYWLKGSKKGKMEIFAKLPAFPDNVKRNVKGEFWVGVQSLEDDLIGVKLDAYGKILEALRDQSSNVTVSEVVENNGRLWIGSVERSFVGVCRL